MARLPSWLPRLHEIRRSVDGSVRSHYSREDLQRLFHLQPRAAQRLMELLLTVEIGGASLVAQPELLRFLLRVREAEDVAALLERVREEKHAASRKAIRSLVTRDFEPPSLLGLPEGMTLERGRLEIRCEDVTQLGRHMLALAMLLETAGDEVARVFDVPRERVVDQAVEEVRALFADLERREAEHKKKGERQALPDNVAKPAA